MYLQRRSNGVYYFRRRVPSDLEGIIEAKRFHYSLGARTRKEALKAYAVALARSENEIQLAREKIEKAALEGHPQVRPTWKKSRAAAALEAKRKRSKVFSQYSEREINFLVTRWYKDALRATEEHYREIFAFNSPEDRRETLCELAEVANSLHGLSPEMDQFLISRKVSQILEEEDCEEPHDWLKNPQLRRFYALVLEGMISLNRIAAYLVENGEMPPQVQRFDGFIPQATIFAQGSSGNAPANGPSITLDELIERFENEPKRQSLRKATRKEYQLIYRALREQIGGEKLLSAITRDDIKAVANTFLRLPARSTLRNPKARLQDLAAKAEEENAPKADVKTYNKRASNISAIFSYAVVENLIAQHPAKALTLPEPPSSGEEKAYSSEQLKTIFSGYFFLQFIEGGRADQFTPNHDLRPCYFWAPLIALFHGFRSGEILQIKTANVFEKDGVMVLKTEGEVKNQRAYRIVPLHPELIRLGLLTYVDNVRRAGYDRIFPDAKAALADGKYSSWFQKPFARYLKKIGVKVSRNERFHTFRHTWNGGLRRADVPQEIRRALGAWVQDKSAELGYGPQHYPRLLKYLEKLEYPGLSLSHLYPKAVVPKGTHQLQKGA